MNSDDLKKKLGLDDDGTYRVDPETGLVQKEGIFGWKDTETRLDSESGAIQKEGIFGWNDTETRIDPESGVVQKEELLGYHDTDTRVAPDTGIIQKRGAFGWQDTDERIAPGTGEHEVQGIFGWKTTPKANARRRVARDDAHDDSSDSDSPANGIMKLIFGIAAVAFVIWLITSILIPLAVINLALIALVGGSLKKSWRILLFSISVAGGALVIADYNLGWATLVLPENVAFFGAWIKPMFYANILAALASAFFLARHYLQKTTPDRPETSAPSKRDVILATSLLGLGAAIVGIQCYVDFRSSRSEETLAMTSSTANEKPSSKQPAIAGGPESGDAANNTDTWVKAEMDSATLAVRPGFKYGDWVFDRTGEVKFNGVVLTTYPYLESAKLLVSKGQSNGQFRYVVLGDDDSRDSYHAYIWNWVTHRIVAEIQGVGAAISWSPDESHGMIAEASEVQENVYMINLRNGHLTKHAANLVQGNICLIQHFRPEQGLWIDNSTFRLPIQIAGNWYNDSATVEKCKSENAISEGLHMVTISSP